MSPGTSDLASLLQRHLARVEAGRMDIHKMLAELRAHRAVLDETIETMERLAAGGRRRRGRPPKWMSKRRGRPPGSKNRTKEVQS